MANEEHLEILRQGPEVWNQWRKENRVRPDLEGAILSNADLSRADLSNANLNDAILNDAILEGADLSNANFSNAILSGADLGTADLFTANLSNADLSNADLRWVQALYTNFKGAILTGACIEDWHINSQTSLQDVDCEYIFMGWDLEGDGLKFTDRRPHDPTKTFAPGDFAKLVQKSLSTVDLIFREGLDWKAFAYSFKQVEVLHEDAHLEVRSIENKGDGVVIIKVASAPDADKGQIYTDFTQMYEFANKALAGYQQQLEIQGNHINQLLGIVGTSQEVQRAMAENTGDTYNIGKLQAAGFAPRGIANNNTFNDISSTQDLAQAASQIQALLDQLSATYPSSTIPEQAAIAAKAVEAIEAKPTLKDRVIRAIKAGGVEAFKELVDHPAVSILIAAITGWKQAD